MPLYAFVWLPREKLTTALRIAVQDLLSQACKGPAMSWSIALEESGLALLRIALDLRSSGVEPDEQPLNRRRKQMVRGWLPAVEEALAETEDAGRSAALAQRYADGFPMAYRNSAGPARAARLRSPILATDAPMRQSHPPNGSGECKPERLGNERARPVGSVEY